MFLKRRISVLFFSACGTFKYSQDLHAKKNAANASCDVAFCFSVSSLFAISTRTHAGKATYVGLEGETAKE